MNTPLRVTRVFVVAEDNLTYEQKQCLRLGVAALFPGLGTLRTGGITWHEKIPYGSYGEDNILKHKSRFANKLVVYAGKIHVPTEEGRALARLESFAVYAGFYAEQKASKQMTIGAHNLRFYPHFYAGDANRWYIRKEGEGERSGTWPELAFDPDTHAA